MDSKGGREVGGWVRGKTAALRKTMVMDRNSAVEESDANRFVSRKRVKGGGKRPEKQTVRVLDY